MYHQELIETAQKLSSPGKGILAADESVGTIGKRFAPINVENNEDNRRRYRQLLFTTPDLGNYISGAITFEETLFHVTDDGRSFVEVLGKQGIVPGIKVDMGVKELYGTNGETVTQGITGLGERCQRYYQQGARFAKWRAVLKIGMTEPSELSIVQNAQTLARYAAICQANGLVPIVEPEVLMDGDFDLTESAAKTEQVQAAVFKALNDHHVLLEGALLKPNMVRSGTEGPTVTAEDIARATVQTLRRTVPAALPGVAFLSGGMSEEEATVALNEINKLGPHPWTLTFSYGRALQASVLQAWQGDDLNIQAAQAQLLVRARANSRATLGEYQGDGNSTAAQESLHVSNYTY